MQKAASLPERAEHALEVVGEHGGDGALEGGVHSGGGLWD